MLKKLISLFIIIAFTTQLSYARVGQPTFVFAINENPGGDECLHGGENS